MSGIDERVVGMKFDNAQFQKGVADTNNSLASLKQGLNLDGAAKSLDGLNAAGSRFSLAGVAAGVDAIGAKFSALSILGITALVNIGNQAINTGINLVKSLTIGPIADGFSDYNAKLSSVQTIMNATGASIETVSGYFSELDTYADKTIYNLTDMTGAFAKFTNAGVGMDKSVPAIKGIANMVALAGQDAGAASIAMYNLSQSIAGGFLTTTDYKSLNLANVATKEWKGQMVEAAVAAGTLKKTGDGLYEFKGAKKAATEAELFNDHLAEGWASTDALMKVLGDYGNTQTAIGSKAQAAAQDVKSFGMMMETLKAGVGTGWTDTFEILVGNLHEAKALFTPLTATIGGILSTFDEARNKVLGEWKELGGRTAVIDTIKFAFMSLSQIVRKVSGAFSEIFPPLTGQTLMNITMALKNFVMGLTPTPKVLNEIHRTAKGLFAVLDLGRMVIVGVWKVLVRLLGMVADGSGGILSFTANIGDMLVKFRETVKQGNFINTFFLKLHTVISFLETALKNAATWFTDLFKGVEKFEAKGAITAIENMGRSIKPLEGSANLVRSAWEKLGDVFKGVFEFLKPLGEKFGTWVKGVGDTMNSAIGNMNWDLVLKGINTGLFAGLVLLVRKFFAGGFQDAADGGGIIQHIKDMFGGMTETLGEMQNTLRAGQLVAIAVAVALLAASAVSLAAVDGDKLQKALGALAILFGQLMVAMTIFEKINPTASIVKMAGLGTAMILLAIAIRILVESVEALGKLDWESLLKGLVGVTVLLGGISVAGNMMSGPSKNMIATGIGLMFVAVAIKILASAVGDFGTMDWQKMMQGLIGVGIVLGGLALFTQLSKTSAGGMVQGAGLILLGVAIKILASAVNDFANMDVARIQQGLGALTGVLGMLAIFSRVVNPSGMISMGIAMVVLGAALKIMASAISDLGNIPLDVIEKGLVAMAGALLIIAVALQLMPISSLLSAAALIVVAFALKILAEVMNSMGGMSWDEIGRGLTVLAASLLIIAAAVTAMVFALPGAVALLVVVHALGMFIPVLQQLAGMSWDTITSGLRAVATILGVFAIAGLVLGILSPLFAAFGIALVLVGAGALLAGVGILALSVGITALSIAGAAGTASLVTMIMALVAMLPAIMIQVGLALVEFANVIGNSAPQFVDAIVKVLTALLNGINEVAPKIIDTLWRLVVLLVETLVRGIPYLVDGGMRLIVGILQGIGNNIGRVIDEGANIIVQFLNGIGRNIPKVAQAAADLIINFVNGLADAIRNNTDRMNTAGRNLASAIIDGMTSGIRNGIGAVADAARNIASSALDTVKSWLGIKSPSREFKKLGAFSSEGFANGIIALTPLVGKASEQMGKTALSTMKKTLSSIGDGLSSDIDINPTIRPVLDLSDVKNKSKQLNGLLAPPHLSVDGSYAKAATLVERERATREAASETGSSAETTTTGDQYTYIQTINSPKAVSAAETYRATKSLIAQAKDTKKGAPTK